MNSRDQILQMLKDKKHRIYRVLIILAVGILFLFTGHGLYASKCDYSYIISIMRVNGELIDIKLSFDLACKWSKDIKLWCISPYVKIKYKMDEIRKELCYDGCKWDGVVYYDNDDKKLKFGSTGDRIPFYMQIVDKSRSNLDYSKCKLILTFINQNETKKDNKIYGTFDETCFDGYLTDDAGNTYQLSHIQWIRWTNDKYKPKRASFMLQAEIEEEKYIRGYPPQEHTLKPGPEKKGEGVTNPQSDKESHALDETKGEKTLSPPPVQPTPSKTVPIKTWGIPNELLIIVSDGITMRKRNWFGISQLTVLDLVTESNAQFTDKKVCIARGCNANLDVLMHPAETGSHSKEIQEALKKATYPVVKSENQCFYEMLESIPALIKREGLKCPDVIVIISVDSSFYKDINEDKLLNALFKDCAIDNNLGIIYLELNAEDKSEEMDQFIERLSKHKILGARIKRENLRIGKTESDAIVKEKFTGCIKKLLSDFRGGNSP